MNATATRTPAVVAGFLSITDAPWSAVDRRNVHLFADCRYLPACLAVEEVEVIATRARDAEASCRSARVDAHVRGHGWRPVCRLCTRRVAEGSLR